MATNFSEVYALFLGQIDDYELASVEQVELEQVMLRLLINSLTSLQSMDIDFDSVDMANNNFGVDLTFTEKSIVAKALKLEWVREKKYSADFMYKAIGDRDFTAVQGDKYLKQLGETEADLEREIRMYQIEYSYKGFGGF